jgi:hypothetical protein
VPRVLAILAFLTFVPKLQADVIYFNDGNVLIVEKAWVEGDEVKYQTSRGVQSLPKANVRRIQVEKNIDVPSLKKWTLGEVVGSPSTNAGNSTPSTSGATAESRDALSRLRENLRADPSNARAKAELIRTLASVASLQVTQGDFPGAIVSLQEARSLQGSFVGFSTGKAEIAYTESLSAMEFLMRGFESPPYGIFLI